jgi:hypothetical protein
MCESCCCHEGGLVGVQAREVRVQPRLIILRRPARKKGRSADNISIWVRIHWRELIARLSRSCRPNPSGDEQAFCLHRMSRTPCAPSSSHRWA